MSYLTKCAIAFLFLLRLSNLTAEKYYWVGNSGDWSEQSNWATMSGGSIKHLQIPTPFDDVIFDENSFSIPNSAVNINVSNAVCHDFIWKNQTRKPILKSNDPSFNLRIYGSLELSSNLQFQFDGGIIFESTTKGKRIKSAKHLINFIEFRGIDGEWTLDDTLNIGENRYNSGINLLAGTLNTNNQVIYTKTFKSSGSSIRKLVLGSSVLYVSNTPTNPWNWNSSGGNLEIPVNKSTIHFISTDRILISINAPINKSHYNKIILQPNNTYIGDRFQISDSNSINYMECNNEIENAELVGSYIRKAIFKKNVNRIYNRSSFIQSAFFLDDANYAGDAFYDSLTFNPSHVYTFESEKTQSINKYWQITADCNRPIRLHASEPGNTAIIKVPNGISILGTFLILQDIKATGGAKFTANLSYDLSNNQGWTITKIQPRTLYYIGQNQNWNDPINWSLISGGKANSSFPCIPSPIDNVIFDINSFSSSTDSLILNTKYNRCHDFTWLNTVKPCNLYSEKTALLEVYGSTFMSSNVVNLMEGTINFEAVDSSNTISSNGFNFHGLKFINIGLWKLTDSLKIQKSNLQLICGTFNSNGKTIRAKQFISDGLLKRNLVIEKSNFIIYESLEPSWRVTGKNFYLDAKESDIQLYRQDGPKFFHHFSESPIVRYHNVRLMDAPKNPNIYDDVRIREQDSVHYLFVKNQLYILAIDKVIIDELYCADKVINQFSNMAKVRKGTYLSDLKLEGESHFDTLILSPGATVKLDTFKTQHIHKELFGNGNCQNGLVTIESLQPTRIAYLNVKKNNVNLYSVSLHDIQALGSAKYTAYESLDLGNNKGWVFNNTNARDFFWVSGSGNWSDTSHWSLTSGGKSSGCLPTAMDNVHFDSNSFYTTNSSVDLDKSNMYCHDLTCHEGTQPFIFTGTSDKKLRIYGGLILQPQIRNEFVGTIQMDALDSNNFIKSHFIPIHKLVFAGTGFWELLDSINVTEEIIINSGNISTHGNYIKTRRISSTGDYSRILNLDTSIIEIINPPDYGWYFEGRNCKINAQLSKIRLIRTDWRKCFYHKLNSPITDFNVIEFKGKCLQSDGTDFFYLSPGNTVNYLRFENQIQELFINSCKIGNLNCFQKVYAQFGDQSFIQRGNYWNECTFYGNSTYDTLILTAGGIYRFESFKQFKIEKMLQAIGNPCFAMTLQSTEPNYPDTLCFKNKTQVYIDYAELRDQYSKSDAQITVGSYSSDVSGNSNWVFSKFQSKTYGLGVDTVLCMGTKLNLTTEKFGNAVAYLWNDGSTKDYLEVSNPGEYWVKVTFIYKNDTCWVLDSIKVTYSDIPIIANFDIIRTKPGLCLNAMDQTAYFDDKSQFAVSGVWKWDDGLNSNYIPNIVRPHSFFGEKDKYNIQLNVKNKFGCEDSTSKTLCYSDTIFCLIPNVFTPNSDSKNDELHITILGNTEADIVIYNRWGQIVFHSPDNMLKWDGTFLGKQCQEGIYTIIVTVRNNTFSNRSIKSNFLLTRPK